MNNNHMSVSGGYFMDAATGQIMFASQGQVYLVDNSSFAFQNHDLQSQMAQLQDTQHLAPFINHSFVSPFSLSPPNSPAPLSPSIPGASCFSSSPCSSSSSSEIDEIVKLTNLLYKPLPNETSDHQLNEFISSEFSSIPSFSSPCSSTSSLTPQLDLGSSPSSSLPSSPSLSSSSSNMQQLHRNEVLPGIESLSDPMDTPIVSHLTNKPSFSLQHQEYQQYQLSARGPSSLSLPSFNKALSQSSRPSHRPPSHATTASASTFLYPDSPPLSPKRNKKNYTKEFNLRFHNLLHEDEEASNEWHAYAQRYKYRCTIKRSPCIKVSRGFCASYGKGFIELARDEKYGALGTRTECVCGHKPSPLIHHPPSSTSSPTPSSSPSVHRKPRATTRSVPYPSSSSSSPSSSSKNSITPQETELPCSPQDHPTPTKQWVSLVVQNASTIFETFNSLGGTKCSECGNRRRFDSRDEVTTYLMGEGIMCMKGGCRGRMQLHVESPL